MFDPGAFPTMKPLKIVEAALAIAASALGACSLASSTLDGAQSQSQSVTNDASALPDGSATDGSAADDGGATDLSELPPTESAAALEAWIAGGYYKSWACEAMPHPSRPPSGHSPNRVCSNRTASAHDAGEYPVGAASVKELYDTTGQSIVGYAVARKMAVGGGESWYWYERLDSAGVIANGLGTSGTPKTVCAGCHKRAGTSTFGHDMVFTQVRATP